MIDPDYDIPVQKTSLKEVGAKDDSLKPDLDLVLGGFSKALWKVGELGTFGARKYTPDGWKYVPNGVRRYSSALMRHWFLEQDGEMHDPEHGLPHAVSVAWNALAKLELLLEKLESEKEKQS